MPWAVATGAPVNQVDRNGYAPLAYAIQLADVGMVTQLLQAGASPNLCRTSAPTPLAQAVAQGTTEIVRLLLDAGADPNLVCSDPVSKPFTSLAPALENGNAALVDLLLERGANPRAQVFYLLTEESGSATKRAQPSLLMYAARSGDLGLVQKMITLGQDPRYKASDGHDALAFAAWKGNAGVVEFLLPLSDKSEHAVTMAEGAGHRQIVDLLRKAGYR